MRKQMVFKKEDRKNLMDYMKVKAEKKALELQEKALKNIMKELFAEMGKTFKNEGKTSYLYGNIQEKGKEKFIVYKETERKGAIDWEAYAKALGGNDKDAEEYRKAGTVVTSIEWATDKQVMEISGLQ